jgi:hypothetical protein
LATTVALYPKPGRGSILNRPLTRSRSHRHTAVTTFTRPRWCIEPLRAPECAELSPPFRPAVRTCCFTREVAVSTATNRTAGVAPPGQLHPRDRRPCRDSCRVGQSPPTGERSDRGVAEPAGRPPMPRRADAIVRATSWA